MEKQSELKLEKHSSLLCKCLCILDFLSFFTSLFTLVLNDNRFSQELHLAQTNL